MSFMDIKCMNEQIEISNMVDVVSDNHKYQCSLLNQYSFFFLFFLPMLILVDIQELIVLSLLIIVCVLCCFQFP